MDYRKAWRDRGQLYSASRPAHEFQFWRVIGQWRWADDCWSVVTANGHMYNYAFCVCTVNTLDGHKAIKIIIGKLSLMLGIADAGD